jgi:hypothetical protein
MSVISLESDTRPRLKFTFRLSDYHKIYRSDGSVLSESEASCLHALSTIRAIRSIYTQNVNFYKPPYDKNAVMGSYGKKPFESKTSSKSIANFDDLTF